MLIYYATPEKKTLFVVGKSGLKPAPPDILKNPFYRFFRKKILILGKEWTYFLKRRYPPLSERDLKKAISSELPDLISLKDPAWVHFITRRGETFTEVTLVAWDKAYVSELREEFPFSHLIPEELLFLSKEPSLSLVKREEKFLLVASEGGLFLNSLFGKAPLSTEDLLLFLKSLGDFQERVKRVTAYQVSKDEIMKILPEPLKPYLVVKDAPVKEIPELITSIHLKKFRVKEPVKINLEEALVRAGRLFLVGVIALQLNAFLSNWEYERAISRLKKEIKKIDFALQTLTPPEKAKAYTLDEEKIKALRELEEEFASQKNATPSSPLALLDELAGLLPDGAKIERFSLRERKLEIFVDARDLFEVLSKFRKNPLFSEVKLASSPNLRRSTNTYQFRLEIELK
mgnify:CR=1 FL=1